MCLKTRPRLRKHFCSAIDVLLILTFHRNLNSPIVTITVGPSQRLFAAHQETLNKSPYFAQLCSHQFFETTRRIGLPNEEPEVFSAILEYLYKGDYTPRLEMDKKRGSWYLADGGTAGMSESAIYQASVGAHILKDTAIYVCYCLLLYPLPFSASAYTLLSPFSLLNYHC